MFWKSAFLATLACNNAAAFVAPSRGVLTGARQRTSVTGPPWRARARGSEAPNMRYVAMNRFKVKIGCEDEFETVWRERESKLDTFSGFEQFMLLKLDTKQAEGAEEEGGSAAAKAGYTEFVSHTTWAHQMDFEEWRRSQAFKKSHGGGGDSGGKGGEGGGKPGSPILVSGMGKIRELVVEPPTPALYDAVIIEPVPPEHQGGLWEFEDEPSYFDGDL